MVEFHGILDDIDNGVNAFVLDDEMTNEEMNDFNPYDVKQITGRIVKHKKTGNHYYVKSFVFLNHTGRTELAVEYIQSPRQAVVSVEDLVHSVLKLRHPIHVRPCIEFFDGRFEVLSE